MKNMKRRSKLFSWLTAIVVVVAMWFWYKRWSWSSPLEVAHQAHHAEPPKAKTAVRAYTRAAHRGQTQALLPMARILHHGLPQGPEPVEPNPRVALDLYLQAALWGDLREQAMARDMMRQLPFPEPLPLPPPPRRQHVPTAPRIRRLEPIQGRRVAVHSDSQNVHDTTIVKSIRKAVDTLEVPSSQHNASEDLRSLLSGWKHEQIRQDALQGLELMERNTIPLSAMDMTEVQILGRVWKRILDEQDPSTRQDMTNMLVERLAESGREASCASGRVARVVDSLSTFDERIRLKPTWVLRKEMLDRASVLFKNNKDSQQPFVETLRKDFYKDYVDTGIASKAIVDAELAEWGSSLSELV